MSKDNIMIRKAERQDVQLLLDFIRGIAQYEKMENEVVASAEVLEREMFDEHRAEAVFAVVDGREVGFALYILGRYINRLEIVKMGNESNEESCE